MGITNFCVVTGGQKFNYYITNTVLPMEMKEYDTRTNLIVDVIIPFVATQDQDR